MNRHSIRNTIKPLCIYVEDKLLSKKSAQRFRRLQHQIFGLTNHEWTLLSAYFTTYEELGVTVQREKWLRGESVRLKCILVDEMSLGEQRPGLVHEYADILHERENHRQAWKDALFKWRGTEDGLKGTPLYRGICETRNKRLW
ncbi:hypothetical protein BDV19DRAFT_363943 [Aspergillus venezuelensis]